MLLWNVLSFGCCVEVSYVRFDVWLLLLFCLGCESFENSVKLFRWLDNKLIYGVDLIVLFGCLGNRNGVWKFNLV